MRKLYAEERTIIDADETTYFRERTNTLREDYPPKLAFNMDATCWHLNEAPRRVLEEKGKDPVKLRSHKSRKTSFPAFGGIACSGISRLCG
jgi:hypothetical protein